MIYQFKSNSPVYNKHLLDPKQVHDRLAALRGGPREIVEDAKDASSPLHPAFKWDISPEEAQQYFWEDQARDLVQALVVVVDEEEGHTAPAMVSIVVDDQRQYVDTLEAISDDEIRGQVIAEARRGLANWRRRYGTLEQFARVTEVIDEVLEPVPA